MRTRFLILLLSLFSSLAIIAQETIDYTPLANRLADYGRLTMSWDIDGLLDLTDPQLFDFFPRETLRQQMSGLASDENMEVTLHDFTVDRIGEAISQDQETFAPVDCHHGITFRMKSAEYQADSFFTRMTRMLEKSYGNVQVDLANHTIEVSVPKSMFAILRDHKNSWCFVEYRSENAALMDLLVPPAVRERLK
jgi:hypothetical protein